MVGDCVSLVLESTAVAHFAVIEGISVWRRNCQKCTVTRAWFGQDLDVIARQRAAHEKVA